MSGLLKIITILRFHRLPSRIASHLTTEHILATPISHAHVVYVLRDRDRERERERERESSLSTFGRSPRTFPRIQQTAFCQDSRFQVQRFICPRAPSILLTIFTRAYSYAPRKQIARFLNARLRKRDETNDDESSRKVKPPSLFPHQHRRDVGTRRKNANDGQRVSYGYTRVSFSRSKIRDFRDKPS